MHRNYYLKLAHAIISQKAQGNVSVIFRVSFFRGKNQSFPSFADKRRWRKYLRKTAFLNV